MCVIKITLHLRKEVRKMKIKKLITLVLCTIFVVGMLPLSAVAADLSGGEGVSGEARPFTYYFPDPGFAQEVAKHFLMYSNDYITEAQLKTLTNFTTWNQSQSIQSIEGIGYLKGLQTCYLYNTNELDYIPESIGNLIQLKDLNIYGKFNEIPDAISKLKSLKNLQFSNTNIAEIPESISELKHLEEFKVMSRSTIKIPYTIGELRNLKIFQFSNVIDIPESFKNLLLLEQVHFFASDLTEIPNYFENFKNLKKLIINDSKISEIPIFLVNLKNLEILGINSAEINTIPEFIKNFESLYQLSLIDNNITYIPDYVGELKTLKHLSVGGNSLKEIPKNLESGDIELEICNQYCTIDKKIFQHGYNISAKDLMPTIINQILNLYGVNNDQFIPEGFNDFSWTIMNNDTLQVDYVDVNNIDSSSFILDKGNYTICLQTGFNYGYKNLLLHMFIIPVEITDVPLPKTHTYPIDGSAKSNNGGYDVTLQGTFNGELEDGRNVLSASQLSNIEARGIAKNTQFDEVLAFNANRITGADVTVTNGEITEFIVYGHVKTASGKKENFAIKSGEYIKSEFVWSGHSSSINNGYDVYVSGELPTTLSEGRNVFGVSQLANMNIRGLYVNKLNGESKFINQNQITSLEIQVTGGQVTKIIATGSAKTPSGVKEVFEVIINN